MVNINGNKQMNRFIRDVKINENAILTKIAFSAKGFWNYPNEFIEKWKDELNITSEYINENIFRCNIIDRQIDGFYSIIYLD